MKTKVVLFEKENFVNLVAGIEFIPTFAVLKVDELNHLAGRKLRLAFRGEVHQLSAAYMAAAFLLPII